MIPLILQQMLQKRGGAATPLFNFRTNQAEELDYFKAYLLPISEKANIQETIDTYGSVRLEKGDYTGVDIVMKSNQRLYGHPSLTKVSNILISSGSSKVHLENLFPQNSEIEFQAGNVISGCTIKTIKWATLVCNGAKIENNTFINYGGHIQFDCSVSGYFRNNKTIRHQSGTVSNVLIMKGNTITPSYGNVNLWTNILTPHGDATDISNLQSATFVGMDSESWNYKGEGSKAMFYARNIGDLKISNFNGGSSHVNTTASFDIDATNLLFISKILNKSTDTVSSKTKVTVIDGLNSYLKEASANRGFDLLGNVSYTNSLDYNGSELVAGIVDPVITLDITTSIINSKKTPWSRPIWKQLPDPTGANWKRDRIGRVDSSDYIQNLIDTEGIAELPEGVFYISKTLKIPTEGNHGITGNGTAKTAIVAMQDTFPILTLLGSSSLASIHLNYLTLQGGSVGYYDSTDFGTINIAYQNMKYVIFRNQNYAIHINKNFGFDNNFFDSISFVDCNVGLYQEPTPGGTGESYTSYVDKTVFYNCQFINCGKAFSMVATRANNLNAWINCNFDGGTTALELSNNNASIVANCDFKNYKGSHLIEANAISMYNCKAENNSNSKSTFLAKTVHLEGCEFKDNTKMFAPVVFNSTNQYILNSKITGDVIQTIPSGQGFYPQSGIFVNSILSSNPTLSKTLVNIKENVPLVLIDGTPNPYPQLLVS